MSGRTISGLTSAAKALWVASADHPLILVVPTDRDVESMTGDIRLFAGLVGGLAPDRAARSVLPFPSYETDPYRGLPPHMRVVSARARALHAAATGEAAIIVASAAALPPRVSAPQRLRAASIALSAGLEVDPQLVAELLADAGFAREDPVDEHGQFCVRGGVVDLFPTGDSRPIRLEFLGDTIESIRRFDPTTQRSVESLQTVLVEPIRDLFERPGQSDALDRSATLFDYLPGARLVVSEEEAVMAGMAKYLEQIWASYAEAANERPGVVPPADLATDREALGARLAEAVRLEELTLEQADAESAAPHIACQPVTEFRGRVSDWIAAIRNGRQAGDTVVALAATAGRAERLVEILGEYDVPSALVPQLQQADVPFDASVASTLPVLVAVGGLSRGFRLPAAHLQFYAETDLFDEERRVTERRPAATRAFLSDFRDLKVGDLVVHVDHGIGAFTGLRQIAVDAQGDARQEFLEIRYAGEDKLYVPIDRLDLVQKYSGGARPALDRLGGTTWERAKTRVKKAMRDMAGELLKLYAARKAVGGYAFAARHALAGGVRGSVRVTTSPPTRRRPSPTSSATWNRPRRWTACCAATSATARPKWPCGPHSRR